MKYSTNIFSTVIIGLTIGLAVSGESLYAQEPSLEEVLKCDEINDAAERLKCFDAVVELLKAAPPQQPLADQKPVESEQDSAVAPAAPKPSPQPTPEQLFGDPPPPKVTSRSGDSSQPERPKELREVISGLKNYWRNNDKDYVVVLENGQIWQTLDGSRLSIPSNPVDVRIKKNFLGSYVMVVRNSKRSGMSGKVKRIR